jgi:hypothetical protein
MDDEGVRVARKGRLPSNNNREGRAGEAWYDAC